jgi:hypothetical protein
MGLSLSSRQETLGGGGSSGAETGQGPGRPLEVEIRGSVGEVSVGRWML